MLKSFEILLLTLLTALFFLTIGCDQKGDTEPAGTHLVDIRSAFDDLDSAVNEGRGYKDFLNPDGFPTGALLAWSESYLMQAYAEMFRATGDERYLDKLHEHIDSVMRNRDDFRGQVDYKGDLVPAWGTNRYTRDGTWMHFAAHTGMITYPMLEFVQLVRDHRMHRLADKAETVLARVRESVDYHDREWSTQGTGAGLYTYPEDPYHKPNYVIPLSQQATMGRSLILLWELTDEKRYFEKARDIALAIKGSLQDSWFGGYIWGVEIGPLSYRNRTTDISHSTITVDFIRLAYEGGVVFDIEDMKRLTLTIKHLLADGRAERYIDGTGDYAYEVSAGQYAMLAPYETGIWKRCYDLLFELYHVDLTSRYFQEDWWGTVMLGIAWLTRYAVEARNP